jgi:hypothetical protein
VVLLRLRAETLGMALALALESQASSKINNSTNNIKILIGLHNVSALLSKCPILYTSSAFVISLDNMPFVFAIAINSLSLTIFLLDNLLSCSVQCGAGVEKSFPTPTSIPDMSDIAYACLAIKFNTIITINSSVSPSTPVTPLDADVSAEPTASAPAPKPERVRRKLDLNQGKRGAFSVLMGTLSKAKKEDKQRNASEAVRSFLLE